MEETAGWVHWMAIEAGEDHQSLQIFGTFCAGPLSGCGLRFGALGGMQAIRLYRSYKQTHLTTGRLWLSVVSCKFSFVFRMQSCHKLGLPSALVTSVVVPPAVQLIDSLASFEALMRCHSIWKLVDVRRSAPEISCA